MESLGHPAHVRALSDAADTLLRRAGSAGEVLPSQSDVATNSHHSCQVAGSTESGLAGIPVQECLIESFWESAYKCADNLVQETKVPTKGHSRDGTPVSRAASPAALVAEPR